LASDIEALRTQLFDAGVAKPLPEGQDARQEERIAALTAQVQSLEEGLKAFQDEVMDYFKHRGWK
jgi:hypothetical protein